MENVIIKFVADTSGLKPAIDQLQLLGKISEADAASFAKINDEQKEFIQNLNKSTTEFGKLNSEVEGLMAEIQAGVMEGFADHLAEVTAETKKAGTGFKSMKAELRELKAQIASGSLGEKELKEATKRAAELQDTIGDVSDKVKALASDTKRIDAVVTAFRGIAAAASVAAGAAALFGNENEKLTKTLAQAQGAMALLQGVQELANIATTEGALRTMVLDGAQKAAAISSRALGVTITASMAMATAGISVLVAGLVYFISTMNDVDEEHSKITANIKDRNKNLGDTAISVIEQRIKRKKDSLEKELELEDFYDSEARAKIRERFRKQEIDETTFNLELQNQQEQHLFNIQKIRNDYAKKSEQDAITHRQRLAQIQKEADDKQLQQQLKFIRDEIANNELLIRETNNVDKKIEYYGNINKLRKAQIELDKGFTNNEKILNQELLDDDLRRTEENLSKRSEAEIETTEQVNEAKTEANLDWWEKYFEVENEYLEKSAKLRTAAAKEWAKFSINQAGVISDTIFTINANRRNAETEQLLTSLDTQREAELNNQNLTDAQRTQIEMRYQEQERRIKQQAWEADKQAAISQAVINGALAITSTFAQLGFVAGAPAAIAQGIATAAQIAIIESQQAPKFEKGGVVGGQLHVSGGTLIEAEKGEFVVNRHSSAEFMPSLKAINDGSIEPTFANNILTALANGTFDLAAQFQGKQQSNEVGIDYAKLDRIMAKNKASLNLQVDENGLKKWITKQNNVTEFRNTKLRLKN